MTKLPTYGGQALIEGVMMRGSNAVAMAMRAPNQEIVIKTEPLGGIYKSKLAKIPFLRGLIVLWDALGLGMRALTISANIQNDEEEQLEGPMLYLSMAFSLGVGVLLFFLLPAWVGGLGETFLNFSHWSANLAEGVVRLILLVGYIWGIGQMEEIKRVFAYHGAEHKTINAFEDNAELTPEVVARYSLEHPRCGTAFLLNIVVFSILLFSLLGPLPTVWKLASRILLLPVLAGITYEYQRWTANHLDNAWVKAFIKPSLALQHLTTREPSLDIIEVSIAAFNAMRTAEQETVL